MNKKTPEFKQVSTSECSGTEKSSQNDFSFDLIKITSIVFAAGVLSGIMFQFLSASPKPPGSFIDNFAIVAVPVIAVTVIVPLIIGLAWLILAGFFFIIGSFFGSRTSDEYFSGERTETASFGFYAGAIIAGGLDGFILGVGFSFGGIIGIIAGVAGAVVVFLIAGSPGEIQ